MLAPVSESFGKIFDGLSLLTSGVAGLLIPLIALLSVVALIKWFAQEPVKASRLTIGALIMFFSIFVPPLVAYIFDYELQDHPLLFIAAVLVSVYCGAKLGKLVMGKYGDEVS